MAETKQQPKVTEVHKHECFLIARKDNNKFCIVLGNAVISLKEFETVEKAKKYIDKKPYELIYNGSMWLAENKKGGKA